MAIAAVDLTPSPEQMENRVLMRDVPWSTYVVLRDTVPGAGVRMTYLCGLLEIMSPSRQHEVNKTQIARFLELFCLERDIPLFGYGSMTMRKEEKERGLEPDECYARGEDKPTPDLALEVEVSKAAIDKLEVYRGLGVSEVWRFRNGAFFVFRLADGAYVEADASLVLPELDLGELAGYVVRSDQHAALREYRDAIRGSARSA